MRASVWSLDRANVLFRIFTKNSCSTPTGTQSLTFETECANFQERKRSQAMMVVAVTGHMDLTDSSAGLVSDALLHLLSSYADEELTGISCLARGADTLFAEAILRIGGRLIVILPSHDYRKAKVKLDHAEVFDRLSAAAAEVVIMNYRTANRAAYESANNELLRRADRLVAVWDGSPPSGKGGGTADTVLSATESGIPLDVVWPQGAQRLSASHQGSE